MSITDKLKRYLTKIMKNKNIATFKFTLPASDIGNTLVVGFGNKSLRG